MKTENSSLEDLYEKFERYRAEFDEFLSQEDSHPESVTLTHLGFHLGATIQGIEKRFPDADTQQLRSAVISIKDGLIEAKYNDFECYFGTLLMDSGLHTEIIGYTASLLEYVVPNHDVLVKLLLSLDYAKENEINYLSILADHWQDYLPKVRKDIIKTFKRAKLKDDVKFLKVLD